MTSIRAAYYARVSSEQPSTESMFIRPTDSRATMRTKFCSWTSGGGLMLSWSS